MQYNVIKAVSLAKKIIRNCGENSEKMGRIKLMKLMYLSERQMYATFNTLITHDSFASMKNGMILSNTYALIEDDVSQSTHDNKKYWDAHFGSNAFFVLDKKNFEDNHQLDRREILTTESVIRNFGEFDDIYLMHLLHKVLLEWKGNTKGAIHVPLHDLDDIVHPIKEDFLEDILRT